MYMWITLDDIYYILLLTNENLVYMVVINKVMHIIHRVLTNY